jgi:hypothetical protein
MSSYHYKRSQKISASCLNFPVLPLQYNDTVRPAGLSTSLESGAKHDNQGIFDAIEITGTVVAVKLSALHGASSRELKHETNYSDYRSGTCSTIRYCRQSASGCHNFTLGNPPGRSGFECEQYTFRQGATRFRESTVR